MAQMGELVDARSLFRRAHDAFLPQQTMQRARCMVARAEVDLALREPSPVASLEQAALQLSERGDDSNAAYARVLVARTHLLFGALKEVDIALSEVDLTTAPPALSAIGNMVEAQGAARRALGLRAKLAIRRALGAAQRAGVPALLHEVRTLEEELARPAARLDTRAQCKLLYLEDVQTLRQSQTVTIDACRRAVALQDDLRSLATRPVLFAIAQSLGAAAPHPVPRSVLIRDAFESHVNESLRARLRVEVGRLRRHTKGLLTITATKDGYAMNRVGSGEIVVLRPPVEGPDGALAALLADGAPWSSSSLGQALGVSPRTVQRGLARLYEAGRAAPVGRGRARRWVARPFAEFTTALLLPAFGFAG